MNKKMIENEKDRVQNYIWNSKISFSSQRRMDIIFWPTLIEMITSIFSSLKVAENQTKQTATLGKWPVTSWKKVHQIYITVIWERKSDVRMNPGTVAFVPVLKQRQLHSTGDFIHCVHCILWKRNYRLPSSNIET